MPDFRKVAEQVVEDEKPVIIPQIKERNGQPYIAPDGSKATISVIGSESERYRKQRDEIWRKAAEASEDTDAAATRIAIAASAVTGWHGWGSNGVEPPCTAENVSVLLTVEHILLQVEAGIGRRTDFFADASSG